MEKQRLVSLSQGKAERRIALQRHGVVLKCSAVLCIATASICNPTQWHSAETHRNGIASRGSDRHSNGKAKLSAAMA